MSGEPDACVPPVATIIGSVFFGLENEHLSWASAQSRQAIPGLNVSQGSPLDLHRSHGRRPAAYKRSAPVRRYQLRTHATRTALLRGGLRSRETCQQLEVLLPRQLHPRQLHLQRLASSRTTRPSV
jgi:hypothetical protein